MKLDELVKERERYNQLMFSVLEGTNHLTKKGKRVSYPLTEEQKQKDIFLYKYYEQQYYKLDKLIRDEIYSK